MAADTIQVVLLSGTTLVELNRAGLRDVRHLYEEVSTVCPLDMFTLLDGETELTARHNVQNIIRPLTLIRHCQKTLSLHNVIEQMAHMGGSANVGRLKDRVADDPNLLQLETKGHFYARLYGVGTDGHGYIEQARVLLLYDNSTARVECSMQECCGELLQMTREMAITKLCNEADAGKILLNPQRLQMLQQL
jgi:hypothetical protein